MFLHGTKLRLNAPRYLTSNRDFSWRELSSHARASLREADSVQGAAVSGENLSLRFRVAGFILLEFRNDREPILAPGALTRFGPGVHP